ncbi:MAG: SCO family protein [Cyclobacteriaceae bacterium]
MIRFFFISLAISVLGCEEKSEKPQQLGQLPYYNEATFTPKWFESIDSIPERFHQIPEFNFQNQLGQTITDKTIKGKIAVVDFFFTSCPGICPKMTANMTKVQQEFLEDDEIQLLSHSVTPEYDSISVLKDYADKNGVVDGKWHLLTGERDKIYELGRYHYFVEEDMGLTKDSEDFLHTENFVLIDQHRYIRGIYNGLNKASIAQLFADIRTLKRS